MDKFSSLRSKIYKKSAFTLIEILIAIAVLVTVSTVGFFAFTSYKGSQNVRLTMSELAAVIKDVQRRSITEQDGKRWGLRFINSTSTIHSYEVFSGVSYASGTVNSLYPLKRGVAFGNPSDGLNVDAIFNPISGKLGETRIISLVSQRRDNLVGDVTMLPQGKITTRLETGVVGYWHFDEATSTKSYDSSGFGNTGTLTNGPTWQTSSNCKAGECLSFDGVNDYIQLGASQPYADAVTVSAWVFHNSTSDWDDIVVGGCGNVLFGFSNNNLAFGGQCNDPFNPITYTTNINGAWHYVVGTYDSSIAVLYVDGSAVASSTKSGSFSVFTPRIGGEGATENFNGRIDEVRIYNRALSAEEILNHYNDLK
ncbi:MAG: prepilin-type N-terminal cleavage/methylation domain-containing protein [Patescibacteria group bacterium]|nr:prepilin-type N-terminal cleavage/methylation domain-containing protein [Patescibacteria group bacterium]